MPHCKLTRGLTDNALFASGLTRISLRLRLRPVKPIRSGFVCFEGLGLFLSVHFQSFTGLKTHIAIQAALKRGFQVLPNDIPGVAGGDQRFGILRKTEVSGIRKYQQDYSHTKTPTGNL